MCLSFLATLTIPNEGRKGMFNKGPFTTIEGFTDTAMKKKTLFTRIRWIY